MLNGGVLPAHVQRGVLGHAQQLLHVVLHGAAVLVVDGVTVTHRAPVLTINVRLTGVEPANEVS